MSNGTITSPPTGTAARTAGSLKVTQTRVLRSEWTKFRSLRSTIITLLVAVVLTIGLGALFSAVTASQFGKFRPAEQASFNAVATSLGGITFSQLAVGVLGVLLVTGEYSTGMIRASLTAVPRRLPVLWAKLAVFAAVVLVVSLVASFVSFYLGQSLLSSKGLDASISDPGSLRSVIGSALYVTVAGMIGVALGTLLRNTAAGISTFVGLFFVVPPLTMLLPSSWTSSFVQYLPSNAGGALFGDVRGVANPLSPWTGFAVLCVWAVVLVGGAAYRMRKADA
ncbi:ABC transporter permease [Rhodococcus antarcticus]|uniref:ABC transporter permease n=1 Tax=Rhodococcus antarcticus TaxID=2987751 RepID=A0ABY6NXN0_9NOCA|nr:ABC transporter permease subunit [Rhodococcus antarcticus]UZJ24147.1 ABC transporter permease [Rhodococcus antarcticus]